MLFDIGDASDQCSAWLAKSKPLRAVIRNPFVTALLVTAIVFAVLYALLGAPLVTARWQTILRAAIYSLIAVTLVMVVHNYVTACDVRERTRDAASANILAGIEGNLGDVPVVVGSGSGGSSGSGILWGSTAGESLLPGAVSAPQSVSIAPTAPVSESSGGASGGASNASSTMTPIPLPVEADLVE